MRQIWTQPTQKLALSISPSFYLVRYSASTVEISEAAPDFVVRIAQVVTDPHKNNGGRRQNGSLCQRQ
jgi:hypothetical protein